MSNSCWTARPAVWPKCARAACGCSPPRCAGACPRRQTPPQGRGRCPRTRAIPRTAFSCRPPPQTPDPPAVAEAVPGYEAYTWNGMFVPAATPAPVIRKLSDSLGRALQDPALKSKAHGLGLMLEDQPTAAALDAFLQVELDKWGRVAAAARISAE